MPSSSWIQHLSRESLVHQQMSLKVSDNSLMLCDAEAVDWHIKRLIGLPAKRHSTFVFWHRRSNTIPRYFGSVTINLGPFGFEINTGLQESEDEMALSGYFSFLFPWQYGQKSFWRQLRLCCLRHCARRLLAFPPTLALARKEHAKRSLRCHKSTRKAKVLSSGLWGVASISRWQCATF